jgi:hypothetical protein
MKELQVWMWNFSFKICHSFLTCNLEVPHNFDDAFEIGQLIMCNNDNPFKTKRLLVWEDSMCTNPALNMSLQKTLFPFLFHMDVQHMMKLVIYCLFYIISTILTLDVPRATSNSTSECYKTFMFREGCTKIKMPTYSMIKNWCCLSILRWFHIILAHDSQHQEQPSWGGTYPCFASIAPSYSKTCLS